MNKTSIEVTIDWAETRKKFGKKKSKFTYWTYKNNVESKPKTGRL